MKLNKKIVTAMAATAAIFGSVGANAQKSTNGSFEVRTTVVSSCFIQTQNIAFGNVQVTNAEPIVRNSSVDVTCSKGVPYQVALSEGFSADATARHMNLAGSPDATEKLSYGIEVVVSSGGVETTHNWGVADEHKLTQTGVDNVGGTKTFAVIATIPGSQFVTPGAYTDTLTATITY